jgi:hypothetical protein
LGHEVLNRRRPGPAKSRVIHHDWDGGGDDIAQQLDWGDRLTFSLWREGEAEMRYFVEGETERPDVGFDSIRSALDSLRLCRSVRLLMGANVHAYRHVVARTSERAGDRIDSLAADPEITELDHAIPGKKDIGRLDVAVHYPAFVKIVKSSQNLSLHQLDIADRQRKD